MPQAVAGQAKDGTETLVQVRPGFGEPCTGHAAPTATHECDDGSGGRFKVGRAYQQGCDTRVISGACDPCLLSVKCLNFQLNRAVPHGVRGKRRSIRNGSGGVIPHSPRIGSTGRSATRCPVPIRSVAAR